jgi:hypothetical protein
MITAPAVFRIIVSSIVFLTSATAPALVDHTNAKVWGPSSGGLQCALAMLPPDPGGGAYYVRLTVKNLGSANVRFTDGELRRAARGLVDADRAGRTTRPWFSVSGADPIREIVAEPGRSVQAMYASAKRNVAGQAVTFNGSLKPVGASSSIPLQCGPITLKPLMLPK